jgi:dolichol kinase
MSIFLLLKLFSSWYIAVLAAFMLVVLAYPALALAERFPFYKRAVVEREGGELRRQLIIVQLSITSLISIFWGVLGVDWQYVAVVAVMAWGFGDAAAALVGKAFGRRHILHKWIEGAKTVEGTLAMLVVAGLAVFFTLLIYAGQSWYVSLTDALLVAPVCAIVELFSHRGYDTLTVPLSAALPTFALMSLFSLVGV